VWTSVETIVRMLEKTGRKTEAKAFKRSKLEGRGVGISQVIKNN
jgi:hypothetical protein